jgi:hypothetical protein
MAKDFENFFLYKFVDYLHFFFWEMCVQIMTSALIRLLVFYG